MTTVAGPPLEYEDDDEAPRDLTIAELAAIEAAHKASTNGHKAAPSQRVPPHNTAAERALLGAWLLSTNARDHQPRPDDWYHPSAATIAQAITAIGAAGEPVDPITVGDHLERHGDLDRIGGRSELDSLMAETPVTGHAARYAAIIARDAHHRRLLAACDDLTDAIYSLDDDGICAAQHALLAVIAEEAGP